RCRWFSVLGSRFSVLGSASVATNHGLLTTDASVDPLEYRHAHRAWPKVRADAGAKLHDLHLIAREDRIDLFEQLFDILGRGRIQSDHLLHTREVLDKSVQPLDRLGARPGALVGHNLTLIQQHQRLNSLH